MSSRRTKTDSKASGTLRLETGAQRPPLSGNWTSSPYVRLSVGEVALSNERPRSPLKICLDILECIRDEGPSKPTRIIIMANLSTKRSAKYLGDLVSKGLLKENRDRAARLYSLTAEGLDFFNQVKEAESFVAALGLTI